jgi:hypothetical protein
MTTTNGNSNGQPEAPEKKEATTTKSKRQAKNSGLVKSEAATIVLDDHTRLLTTDYLPNHRPITLSSEEMHVVATLDSAGRRPIMADTFQVVNTDILPGHRPIAASTLPISDLHVLPGDRPVAPNDVIDPPTGILMGYLD